MPRPKESVSPFRHLNSSPEAIATDDLRSYKEAMDELGNVGASPINLGS
jgi:hypothetical protein